MRKKTVLAAMCVCAVLFSGCEKTPENVIVREKGKQSIQKYESGESAGGSLAEQLEAPQHYSNLVSYEDGRLVIDTDADVWIPDAEEVHIYEVTAKKETQQMVDDVTEVFFPGAKFYDNDDMPYDTKEHDLKEIVPKLPSGEDFEHSSFTAFVETENGIYDYQISHAPFWMTGIDFQIKKERDGFQDVVYCNEGAYLMDEEDSIYKRKKWSEAEIKKWIRISYEEAEHAAKEKAEKLGLNLELYGWDYKLWFRSEDAVISEKNILDGGYVFYFTREVDGIPITYTNVSGGATEDDIETGTTVPWRYEWCNLTVGGDGTICEAEVSNPYEIGDVQTEHVKLMDFDSVINIYEQMMEISNADLTEWEKIRTYHIRKITFGYTRIYNPEADSTSGILVPVWDFFGEFDSETDEETEKRSGEHSVRSMMTINAIDGSLIDRELGY